MAKHNNESIYPRDTIVTLKDSLLGYDSDNNKRTRNYRVADIASLIIQQLGLAYGNAIISGSVVWEQGLQYTATNLMYIIEGTIYEAPNTTVTLSDADPTLSRIDVIYADTNGTVNVLEGQPAVDPLQPVIDNTSQVMYTFVLIGPGATQPTGVGEDIIYSDNLVTDWANETTSAEQVDFDNTLYINSGTKNIYIKDIAPGESLTFTSDALVNFNDVSSLNFRIRKIDLESTEIRIYFIDEDGNFSSSINLTDGNYGFDGNNITTYQNINLPKTLFTGLAEVKKLVMANSSGDTLKVALDDIRLVTGVYNPPSFGNFLNLLDTPDSYSGHGGKYVRVKLSEDGLEFVSDPDDPTPTENIYNTIAEMLADQGNQTEEFRQKVLDASADPEVTSGRAYYIKQASSTANLTADYERISEADATILDIGQGLETPDCGTVIPLDTVYGHNCNMQSANANTAYTINNENLINAYARVLINAASEPTVSGATQQGGIGFVPNTDMILLVQNLGDAGLVYSFNSIGVNAGEADTLQTVTARGGLTDQNMQILSETPSFIVSESTTLENSYAEIAADTNSGYLALGNSNGHRAKIRPLNMDKSVDITFAGEDGDLNIYSGTWNATTNTPTLANTDTGVKAVEYKVSVAGTQDFGAGNITFAVGDIVANDGSIWYKKVDNNQGGEYTNTDNTNGRLRKYIIPSDFDFENIPANYDNAIWEIRYVHDLGAANITLPNNVTLLFNGGRITNYGTITLDETKIDFTATYPIFDASGDFSGRPQCVKGFITPIHFGAKGDESVATVNPTDNTDAFNAVSQFVGANFITAGFIDQGRPAYSNYKDAGGIVIKVPAGVYNFTSTVTLRAGQIWEGIHSGTFLHFEPTTLGDNFIEIDNGVTANNYTTTQQRYIEFRGFTIHGDVDYDGSGNAGSAIYIDNALWLEIEDLTINKFEYGVYMEATAPSSSAYYNRFQNIDIQQCRQLVYIGDGTAVTSFEDCVFVRRPEFTAIYDHGLEVRNNTTFRNCSFEGGTPTTEMIYAPIGKVTIIGGRDESNSLLKFNGRGVTGGVTVILPNGPAGASPTRYGTITDIDDAPVQADMNDDQNVLTKNINFGQGVAQELKMLKNQSWKLGVLDWTIDGSDGFYELVNDRENLFGSENGIRIEKTNTTSSYAITQPMSINTPKFYATVWVKKSADADLRAQIGFLYASDNTTTSYFKEFIPILQTEGGWTLYVASVAHYYKNVPTNNPRPYLGLTTASPTGSWAIFSNLRFWAGGYPLFSGSDDNQVNKEYVVSALPTQALIESGDIVTYDGTNASYPLDSNSSKGVICNFNLDTTLDVNALDTDTTIEIPDASNVETDDYIGIYKNTGGIHWTTVASVSTNTITLTDALDGDADLGNKVYIYRLIPKESSGGASGGSAITAVKTADQTVNNNNTVALDSELQIALEANSYYDIEVQLLYETDATPDLRTQFEIPTGAEGEFWRVNHNSTTGSAPLTTIISNAGNGIGSARHTRMFVTIYTGINSGTFGVKWAQNTSDAGDTTLKRGSSIKAVKLN